MYFSDRTINIISNIVIVITINEVKWMKFLIIIINILLCNYSPKHFSLDIKK